MTMSYLLNTRYYPIQIVQIEYSFDFLDSSLDFVVVI